MLRNVWFSMFGVTRPRLPPPFSFSSANSSMFGPRPAPSDLITKRLTRQSSCTFNVPLLDLTKGLIS